MVNTSRQSRTTRWKRVQQYATAEVSLDWTDSVLLIGCLATGLLDSAVFNVWSCFVSMQTGNTVYVGLGITGQPYSQPWRWVKSGTSILAFVLGSFIFARISATSPHRRSSLFLSSLLQAILTLVAALMASTSLIPKNAGSLIPNSYIVLLPLTLLALQAGGQCVLSRVLGYGEVPTVVLTSAYCDLAMDPMLFSGFKRNVKRNRRIGSMVMILAGAAIGGKLTRHGEIAGALWLVSGIKVLMALIWLVWPARRMIRLDEQD